VLHLTLVYKVRALRLIQNTRNNPQFAEMPRVVSLHVGITSLIESWCLSRAGARRRLIGTGVPYAETKNGPDKNQEAQMTGATKLLSVKVGDERSMEAVKDDGLAGRTRKFRREYVFNRDPSQIPSWEASKTSYLASVSWRHPMLHSIVNELGPRMKSKFERNFRSVRLDGPDTDSQQLSDLLIHLALGQEANDFNLARS